MIVEVSDARILKFMEMRFKAGDISPTEALHVVVLAMNHLQAVPDLVEMAKVSYSQRGRKYFYILRNDTMTHTSRFLLQKSFSADHVKMCLSVTHRCF